MRTFSNPILIHGIFFSCKKWDAAASPQSCDICKCGASTRQFNISSGAPCRGAAVPTLSLRPESPGDTAGHASPTAPVFGFTLPRQAHLSEAPGALIRSVVWPAVFLGSKRKEHCDRHLQSVHGSFTHQNSATSCAFMSSHLSNFTADFTGFTNTDTDTDTHWAQLCTTYEL